MIVTSFSNKMSTKHKPTRIMVEPPVDKTDQDVQEALKKYQIETISQDSKQRYVIIQFADHSTAKKCLKHIQNKGLFGQNVKAQYTFARNEDQRAANRFFSSKNRNYRYEDARNVCRYLNEVSRDPYRDVERDYRANVQDANSNSWVIEGARYLGTHNGEPQMMYKWAPSVGPLKDAAHNSWSFLFQQNSDLPEPTMKELYTEYKKLNPEKDLPDDPTEGFVATMNE